ncbi:AraC family transcriptional regulator [Herbihabitans rhizosphaerae]|uniref:AraC family transcriptional regulator n=1 Tax=Herbihabitans rhizosphaerae TaxID=1872711 RepID=A0A4Q7KDX1_9PSEU|nr:AraC family transcriptional regulator [Herbihabitans rhizosphaerae]RZS30569.1 AraC family transcriptional regulator [Herbihabitans rhizosphaerae]
MPAPPSLRKHAGRHLSKVARDWNGLRFEVGTWRADPPGEGVVRQADEHVVFVTFSGVTSRTRTWLDGGQDYVGADFPGAVSLIPAGHDRRAWHEGGMIEYATIQLSTHLMPHGHPRLRGFTNQQDPFVLQLADALRTEARAADTAGRLFADSVATTLGLYLLRRHTDTPLEFRAVNLTGRRLRLVLDHIAENLAGDVSLADLAEVAGMDVHRFARAFKAATGQPPHRYVVARRVDRAAELLTATALPIAEIAHLAGFSSQSHLTTVFRKVLGATPHAYRRAC